MLDFITKHVTEGGMKMLKEIPALVMKGWEKAKDLLSFWKESKDQPNSARALSLWEKICQSYEELFDEGKNTTKETENKIDEVLKEDEGEPQSNNEKPKGEGVPQAVAKETPNSQPKGAERELVGGEDLKKALTENTGKKPTAESVIKITEKGIATVWSLREKHPKLADFKKAFNQLAGTLPTNIGSLFDLGFGEKLKLARRLNVSALDLKGLKDTLSSDDPTKEDLDEARDFLGNHFFTKTSPSNLDKVISLARKLLKEDGLGVDAKRDLVAEMCFCIDPEDLKFCCEKLGGKLSS